MSLYMGKYRRTRCSTRQPNKPGYYACFYDKRAILASTLFWNGKHWVYTHSPESGKTLFDSFRPSTTYWAPIPKAYQ